MIGNTTKGKSFGGTVKYVLGKADAQLIYTNVFAGLGAETSAEAIAAEMTLTALRHRTNQPVYHLSVSPAETDRLSVQDWVNFSQDLLQELGLKNHQVVVVLHNDEDYPSGQPRPHAHFVVNLVNEAGKRASTSWDYRRTELALRHLEKCYELTPVLSSWEQHNTVIVQQLLTLETTAELPVAAPADKERSLFVKANYVQSAEEQMQETDANNQPRSPDAQLLKEENSSFQKYRDIFAATARQQAESERTPMRAGTIAGSELEQFGQGLQRYGDREVDGTQLAGAGLSVLGNAVKIADAIAQEIARAREQHQSQRFNSLIDKLEAVGERTAKLEAEIETTVLEPEQVIATGSEDFVSPGESTEVLTSPDRIAQAIDGLETVAERAQELEVTANNLEENSATVRAASLTNSASPTRTTLETESIPDFWAEAEAENTIPEIPELPETSEQSTATAATEAVSDRQVDRASAEDSLANATELLGVQVSQIEDLLDSKEDSEFVPIKIDRQASFNQQLEQIEAAIEYLNNRLDKLEKVVEAWQEQLATSEVPEIAQTLADYANARGEVYGIDPELPIQTRSMGTIEVVDGGSYIVIQNQQDIKFEAVKLNGEWEVTANELSDNETQKLVSLPRTAEAYQAHVDGRELVEFLQRNSLEQLAVSQPVNIQWQGKDEAKDQEFSYSFSITQSPNGVQVVRGIDQDNQAEVFSAVVQADGAVLTGKSEIPSARIDSLLQQEEQQAKAEQQRERSQRAKLAEQELAQ